MSLEQKQIECQFFEVQVYCDGEIMGAPHDALNYSKHLRAKYVLDAQNGTGITYSVNLRPQFVDPTQQGWLVEIVQIKKPKVLFTPVRQELLN